LAFSEISSRVCAHEKEVIRNNMYSIFFILFKPYKSYKVIKVVLFIYQPTRSKKDLAGNCKLILAFACVRDGSGALL
jgi:hypothetical protein